MKVIRLASKSKYCPSAVRFPSDSNAKILVGVDALQSEVLRRRTHGGAALSASLHDRRFIHRMARSSSGPSECSDEGEARPHSNCAHL